MVAKSVTCNFNNELTYLGLFLQLLLLKSLLLGKSADTYNEVRARLIKHRDNHKNDVGKQLYDYSQYNILGVRRGPAMYKERGVQRSGLIVNGRANYRD